MSERTHEDIMRSALAFAQGQVRHCEHGIQFNEERLATSDAYNARHYRAEIERNRNRIAHFQPDIEAFTFAIEKLFGEDTITPELQRATAQLRHLYENMVDTRRNADPVGLAKGILSPQIARLESLTK